MIIQLTWHGQWPPPNNTMMPMPLPHSSSTYGNNHAAKNPLSFPRCKKPAAIVASLFRQQRLHCQHLHCQHLHCQCSLRQRLRCWRCPAMDLPSVVSILSLVTSPFIHLMIKIEGHPSARRRKWSRLTYFFWNTHLYGVLADFHCCFFVLWHSSSHSHFAYEPLCIFYTGISSVPFVMLPDILMRWWKEQQSASPSTQQIMMHGRVGSIWQSILIRGGGYQSKHNLQKMNWITIWAKVRAHWCSGISYIYFDIKLSHCHLHCHRCCRRRRRYCRRAGVQNRVIIWLQHGFGLELVLLRGFLASLSDSMPVFHAIIFAQYPLS